MLANQIDIEYVENLHPIFTKPKRVKIVVGGRGSTKSTGITDYVIAKIEGGELWCCARENQNSIEESVHRTILEEIDRLGVQGFTDTKTSIQHASGGRTFYRGLSRNITSLKSTLSGINGLWIEEGEDITDNTLRVLTASVRLNAKDTERLIAGEDVSQPEIIITMNRGARMGAVAQKWLQRAESELLRCGYYEDDSLMVVQMNYTDMPQEWFLASGLEMERSDDYERMTRSMYDHKWLGGYLDEVENSLILGEWFDACIDAHKTLGFEPVGLKMAAHDPSDEGNDDKGYGYRHGSVVLDMQEMKTGNVNEGGDWATGLAINQRVDAYTWDCDGLGVGLNAQTVKAFDGKQAKVSQFKGSEGVDNPDAIFEHVEGSQIQDQKTNKQALRNKRAQYYYELRKRVLTTYNAVVKGVYSDPDKMISFSSTIELLPKLRSELCRMPVKPNGNGLFELYTKGEMKSKFKIESPNLGDCVMMLMRQPHIVTNVFVRPKPIRVMGKR